MKILKKPFKISIMLIAFIIIIGMFFPTWTKPIAGENSISILEQVQINGTGHEIMIRGQDINNPVLIFVHGGPGCSEIPYVTKYQDLLEQNFTVVNYDQRASGKSYHFYEDYDNLSSNLLVEDLLAITDYIENRLGKDKVILVGHSFGTYIAMLAAYEAPEKYKAYIGIGQKGNPIESEIDSLEYCISQANLSGDKRDFKYLQGITSKIYSGAIITPRSYVRKYGGSARLINENIDYVKGFIFGTEYNLLDAIRYSRGILYSQDLLIKESSLKTLPDSVTKLQLPCYFIMGKYDYMTSTNSAKKYFDMIDADIKGFYIYENSAHYPQFEEKERFSEWMIKMFHE